MKKKLLIMLLCLSMTIIATACAGDKPAGDVEDTEVQSTDTEKEAEKEEEQRSNVKLVDEETQETYYLLADFENHFECTQIKYMNTFGKVTPILKSENVEMVPNGEQSVRLEIDGNTGQWERKKPRMRINTHNAFFNATSDFSNLTKISFDVYNDQDFEMPIWFAVNTMVKLTEQAGTFSIGGTVHDDYAKSIGFRIDLEPKKWTHVEFTKEQIDSKLANIKKDLSHVDAFEFYFEYGTVYEGNEVFYFDNLRAYITE